MQIRVHSRTAPFVLALLACAITGLSAGRSHAGAWQIAAADPARYTGRSNGVTVGSDGVAHIAYWAVGSGVRHAWWNGSVWAS